MVNRAQAQQVWQTLTEDGFETKSPNPEWFKAVVASMMLAPGNQAEIEERAHEIIDALGLTGVTYPTGPQQPWGYPSFHIGRAGPRRYHERVGFRVGLNHTFDSLGAYCATHNRSWCEYATPGDECIPSCRLGLQRTSE